MTFTVTPVSGTDTGTKQDITSNQAPAARAVPVVRNETALAPQPVDPARAVPDARAQVLRDGPVGPPPTFKFNVLDEIHARLAEAAVDDPVVEEPPPDVRISEPAPGDDAAMAAADGGMTDRSEPPSEPPAEPLPQSMAAPFEQALPVGDGTKPRDVQHLDIKI